MRETDDGLYVEGQLDIEDSERAREVWRSVKRGRASLSFGFVVKSSHQERDIKVLTEIDLFEVSIVGVPANEPRGFSARRRSTTSTPTLTKRRSIG